jgi:hypothetical protein
MDAIDTDINAPVSRARRAGTLIIGGIVTVLLTGVLAAPMALSAQDLYAWASAIHGLGLSGPWPYMVPLALDAAAAVCIAFAVLSAWRRERPGIFSALVWVFAGASAWAQYTHGLAEQSAGRAQDAWWAMPTFALLGPLLLEVVLNRLRTWARKTAGEQMSAAAGFGNRWLVSPWETLSAWAASRREGIHTTAESIKFVRERKALRGMTGAEQVRYALSAIGVADAYAIRLWLQARGVVALQADIDQAFAGRPVAPVSSPPAQMSGPLDTYGEGVLFDHATRLEGHPTMRDRIRYAFAVQGHYDVPTAQAFLTAHGYTPQRGEFYAVKTSAEQRALVAA